MAFPGFLGFYLDIPFDAILFSLFSAVRLKLSEQIPPAGDIHIDTRWPKAPR